MVFSLRGAVQSLAEQLSSSCVPGSPTGFYPEGSSLLHYSIMSLFAGMGPAVAVLALPVLYVQQLAQAQLPALVASGGSQNGLLRDIMQKTAL